MRLLLLPQRHSYIRRSTAAAIGNSLAFTGRRTTSLPRPAAALMGQGLTRIAKLSTTSRVENHTVAAMSTTTDETPGANEVKPAVEELPPLSDHDFKVFNRMAEKMDYFHDHFRRSWNLLWTACTSGRRPQGMTARQLIGEGLQFAQHLEAHHGIEETYVFPHLARKMPEFKDGRGGGAAELLRQHRQIHAGLEGFTEYLGACRSGERDFDLAVLRTKMEPWGDVLWAHLDQEVKTLGADNMRKYWTKEEILRMPM